MQVIGISGKIVRENDSDLRISRQETGEAQRGETPLCNEVLELDMRTYLPAILRKIGDFKNADVIRAKAAHRRVRSGELRISCVVVEGQRIDRLK